MKKWSPCKNVLCIRADNMGDLLMSSPAIRALKSSFSCKITVLTSSLGSGIAAYLEDVDEVITYDLPWVKTSTAAETGGFYRIVDELKSRRFDAAVIFTVCSQNPLPAAMLAYLAEIPLRLAYCRENPYQLLTHWIPDKEPYTFILHQVRRDLALVAHVGAATDHEKLQLQLPEQGWPALNQKLNDAGIDPDKPWIILHAGVSEKKREYPEDQWIDAGKKLIMELHLQVLLTGSGSEKVLTDRLQHHMGRHAFSLAGSLTLAEFILLISHAPLVVSVNTGPVHIAAATATPVVVLYALSNPQHLPWKTIGKVLPYSIPENERSKNEVLQFVHHHLMPEPVNLPAPDDIVQAVHEVLSLPPGQQPQMPEMIQLSPFSV